MVVAPYHNSATAEKFRGANRTGSPSVSKVIRFHSLLELPHHINMVFLCRHDSQVPQSRMVERAITIER